MRNLESWTIAPTAEFWIGLHYNEYRRPEVESWEVSWDNIRISCSTVYLMTPNDLTSGSVFRYTVISIMKVIHFSTTFLVQIPSTIRKYWHFPEFECLLFTGKILCMNDVYVTHRVNWVRITWGFTQREFATSNCWLVFHCSTAWFRSTESNSSLSKRRPCGQDLRGVTSARRPPHNVHLLTAVSPLVQQGRICRFYRALTQLCSRAI